MRELVICRQVESDTEVQACSDSVANSYTIQLLELVVLAKQYVLKLMKFPDPGQNDDGASNVDY